MACANKKCKCWTWCEVKSREVKSPEACEEAAIISSWWKAKISGVRDPEEDEDFNLNDIKE